MEEQIKFLQKYHKGYDWISWYHYREIEISKNTHLFLHRVGIPVILKESLKVLPFTWFPIISINDDTYYLFGEVSITISGVYFFGLKSNEDTVFLIIKPYNKPYEVSVLNKNLFTFFISIFHFNFFEKKYSGRIYYEIDSKQIKIDYLKLLDTLKTIDELNEVNYFGKHYYKTIPHNYPDVWARD